MVMSFRWKAWIHVVDGGGGGAQVTCFSSNSYSQKQFNLEGNYAYLLIIK